MFTLFPDVQKNTVKSISGQIKSPLLKSKASDIISRDALKPGMSNGKPKGLSIRSNSDINVLTPASFTNKQKYSEVQGNLVKHGKVIKSPNHKDDIVKKDQTVKLVKGKQLKQSKENIFIKPQTPCKVIKKPKYPEPENLAHYYDYDEYYQFNAYKEYIESGNDIWSGIPNSIMQPYVDEGFESDPEQLSVPQVPGVQTINDTDNMGSEIECDLSLPDISEDGDSY